jgi:hypothetical protein
MSFLKDVGKAIVGAVAVAAIVVTGGAALGLTTVAGVATTFAGFVSLATTSALIAGASAIVGGLLAGKSPSLPEQLRGQLISTRAPNAAAYVIYGKTRVGGVQVFIETTGGNNETMYIVNAIAGHEVNAFTKVFINDEQWSGSTYKGSSTALDFDYLYGTDTQTAPAFLAGTTAATNGYAFKGIACLLAKAEYNQDVFPQGLPNFTVEVEGKKVFDPRTNTTGYSTNAALCIRDYLVDTRYGLGVDVSELDEQSFEDAADICDEDVTLAGSGTEKRYTINGAFSSEVAPKDNLARMLTACAGKLSYAGGKWTLRVGAYRSPTLTITEDMVVGGIQVQATLSKRDVFNAIKGVFSDPVALYQPVTFPPVQNSSYETEDGEKLWRDIELPFTTSGATAQRLAKIELEQNRQQITVNLSCNLRAFAVQPGDTVELTLPRYGWTNKIFEVYTWEFSVADSNTGPTPTVNMVLRETASQIYDWSAEENAIDYAPNTNLPDPFSVTPPGISISDDLQVVNQQVFTVLIVDVTGTNTFQDSYEVQAKLATDSEWVNLGRASGNRFELPNVIDGVAYDVRARTINSLGVRSAYTTGNYVTVGSTAPPADVQNFSINIVGSEAHLTWDAVPDLDLSHYVIRHSPDGSASYSTSLTLLEKVSRPATFATVPAMSGVYFIKAVDKLGNKSETATSITTNITSIQNLNFIQTITEDPTFAGLKTDVVVDSNNRLRLDDVTVGEYEFDNVVDLGDVFTARVTSNVIAFREDFANTFDQAGGLFDVRPGLFDGDATEFDDTNVELYISTTDNDPATTTVWTAYQRFSVGDYRCRGMRFKLILYADNTSVTPAVDTLEVTVDMSDRTDYGNDVVSGTAAGGYAVTYSPAFYSAPAVGISAQGMATGDYYEFVSKTVTGFTIRFKNSSGTVISRTFDWIARGFGK